MTIFMMPETGMGLAPDATECHPDAACIHGCTPGSDRVAPVLKDVSGYQNPEVILRIMDKVPCSQYDAEALFEEMKQFLARSAVSTTRSSPSKTVDISWHEFILFTRDYASFCDEFFGRFIHHVPTPRINRPNATAGCEDCSPLSNCETSQVGQR